MLVGDVDMLSDRLWVQVQNFLGQRLATAFANNGDFVVNALDNLVGQRGLIGLRSRATFTRPLHESTSCAAQPTRASARPSSSSRPSSPTPSAS